MQISRYGTMLFRIPKMFVTVYGKTRHMANFIIFLVSYIFDKLYHNANPRSSFRATALRCEETALCNRATPRIIKKLRSKGVAMHAYGVSAY